MNTHLDSTSNPPAAPIEARATSIPRSARGPDGLLALGIAGALLLAAACWPMARRELPPWAAAALAGGLLAWLAVAWKSAGAREPLPEIAPASANVNRLAAALVASLGLAALSWTRTAGRAIRDARSGRVACGHRDLVLGLVATGGRPAAHGASE